MDTVKEAFFKVKEDIEFLYSEINLMKEELLQMKNLFIEHSKKIEISERLNKEVLIEKSSKNSINTSTQIPIFPTNYSNSPTHPTDFKGLKPKNLAFSIGNEGVPTDRQTNQQTNQQTNKSSYNSVDEVLTALDSLDNFKREIRLKFKKLTDQEMAVFSLLYQLSEEEGFSDYKTLSLKLHLTESSIRDYIGRIIKKGVPVDKIKINNKSIQLSISQNLKKIASLQTILKLREI